MKTMVAFLIAVTCSTLRAQVPDPYGGGGFMMMPSPTNAVPYVSEVWTNTGAFARLIATADRVVIRRGGFSCCGSVDGQERLVVLTNAQAISEFNSTITLVKTQEVGFSCMCCGFPGVDWYKGTNRIALTSIQHGEALRWKDFPCDVSFTPESSHALAIWLLDHGIPDSHDELKKIVNKWELPPTHRTGPLSAPGRADSAR